MTQSVNPGTSPPGNIALFTSSKLVFHLCFHSRTPTIQILGPPMPTLSYTVFFLLFTAVSLQIHCQSPLQVLSSSGVIFLLSSREIFLSEDLSFISQCVYLLLIIYIYHLPIISYSISYHLPYLSICLSINTLFIIYP